MNVRLCVCLYSQIASESNNILTFKQTLKPRMSCWLVESIIIDLHSEVDLIIDSLVVQHRYIHLLRDREMVAS